MRQYDIKSVTKVFYEINLEDLDEIIYYQQHDFYEDCSEIELCRERVALYDEIKKYQLNKMHKTE